MRRRKTSAFDRQLRQSLGRDASLAKEYSERFAGLPLTTQLAVMRRRRWLTQEVLAQKMRVKQPHVARAERAQHDPRLSTLDSLARNLNCHLLVVPDELLPKVAGWLGQHGNRHP